jgi:cyanophycinase-like exopeptidase
MGRLGVSSDEATALLAEEDGQVAQVLGAKP